MYKYMWSDKTLLAPRVCCRLACYRTRGICAVHELRRVLAQVVNCDIQIYHLLRPRTSSTFYSLLLYSCL